MNAVKDIRVGVIGKHAFEIHQVLAKYGDGTADLEDGDEDGGPAKVEERLVLCQQSKRKKRTRRKGQEEQEEKDKKKRTRRTRRT